MEPIEYRYEFRFSDTRNEVFEIRLDPIRLEPLKPLPERLPEWTRLEYKRCPSCPLDPLEVFYCPAAARLTPLVERMADVVSIDDVDVLINLGERAVVRHTAAQEGISALMGIITATSGCPHTEFFKPMARFPLPFANTEETFYRAASMYMLGQYYRWQAEKGVDLEMKGLHRFYDKVAEVNRGLADRLRAEKREDGTVNAVVLLDMFVKSMPVLLDETLEELAPLFQAYVDAERVI